MTKKHSFEKKSENPGMWLAFTSMAFIIFMFTNTIAQDVSEIRISGRYSGQPLPQFFESLSKEYNLRFFYQKPWIDTIIVQRDYDGTPLIQVMNSIFQDKNIMWRPFQDDGIVVFPIPEADRRRYVEELQLLVIGDPLNEGRYKNAVLEGRIVDGKTGQPLPGAVILDGQTNRLNAFIRDGDPF